MVKNFISGVPPSLHRSIHSSIFPSFFPSLSLCLSPHPVSLTESHGSQQQNSPYTPLDTKALGPCILPGTRKMLKTNLRHVLSEHLRTVGGLAELKADRGQGLSKRLSINARISLWEALGVPFSWNHVLGTRLEAAQ